MRRRSVNVHPAAALLLPLEWATVASRIQFQEPFKSTCVSDSSEQPVVNDWTALWKHRRDSGDSLFHFHTALRLYLHRCSQDPLMYGSPQLNELISAVTKKPALFALVTTMKEWCPATAPTNNPPPQSSPQLFYGNHLISCQENITLCTQWKTQRVTV